MYRFAARPLWLLSHLFVLASIVAMVNLGAWQLRRHDERAARNATVEARQDLPPVPITDLLDDRPATGAALEELRFRPAIVAGEFGDEVLLVDNRSKDGLPGAWVLAPLLLDDGRVLVVNLGFQGFTSGEIVPPAPPDGPVRLDGRISPWDSRSCGIRTDDAGTVLGTGCLSRPAAEAAFGTDVVPVVVQRESSTPPAAPELSPVPLPELDAGPHRSYAGQWFIFTLIVLIVYPLILRRVARDRPVPPAPDAGTHEHGLPHTGLPQTGLPDEPGPAGTGHAQPGWDDDRPVGGSALRT